VLPVADAIELLKRLQTVDAQLYRLRRLRQDKPRELEAARARAAELEAAARAAQEEMTRLQMAHQEKEVELQTRETRVKQLKAQLFQVKTNKEYTALQHEIESLSADSSLLEEDVLKVLDAIDAASATLTKRRKELQQAQERLAAEQRRVEGELLQIEGELAGVERDRAGMATEVPSEALAQYERVLKIREGLALVPVVNESCGGCHRRLPPQVVNEAALRAKLVACEQCNRILYVDGSAAAV
jgi:hypothetical protein